MFWQHINKYLLLTDHWDLLIARVPFNVFVMKTPAAVAVLCAALLCFAITFQASNCHFILIVPSTNTC